MTIDSRHNCLRHHHHHQHNHHHQVGNILVSSPGGGNIKTAWETQSISSLPSYESSVRSPVYVVWTSLELWDHVTVSFFSETLEMPQICLFNRSMLEYIFWKKDSRTIGNLSLIEDDNMDDPSSTALSMLERRYVVIFRDLERRSTRKLLQVACGAWVQKNNSRQKTRGRRDKIK